MRVFWTDEEKKRLTGIVFTMRQNDPESSLLSIINRAQEQLPADRRRVLPSIKSVEWLLDDLKRRMEEVKNRAAMTERAAQSAQDSKTRQLELQEKLQSLVEVTKGKALQTAPVEDLALELVARMLGPVEEIQRQLADLERRTARLENQKREQVTTEKKMPGVLVAGLLPDQMNHVRAKFRNAVDLRYLDKDKEGGNIPVVDAAVINTKFIQHSTQAEIQRAFNGHGKVYLVNGGLSTVVAKIEQILAESA